MNNEEFKAKLMSGEIGIEVPQEMISDPMINQLGTIMDESDSLVSEEFDFAIRSQSSMKSPPVDSKSPWLLNRRFNNSDRSLQVFSQKPSPKNSNEKRTSSNDKRSPATANSPAYSNEGSGSPKKARDQTSMTSSQVAFKDVQNKWKHILDKQVNLNY